MSQSLTAKDIMRRDVPVLNLEDNLERLSTGLAWIHLRQIPVVDGRQLVGLLDERSIPRLLEAAPRNSLLARNVLERSLEATFVADVVWRDPRIAFPDTPVLDVISRLATGTQEVVPIVDEDGALVGIITAREIAALAQELLEEQAHTESGASMQVA